MTVSDGRGGNATATVNLTVLPAESGQQTQTELSFIPQADAWVTDYHPNSNYGSEDQLRVGGSPVKVIYLRFNVTGVYGAVESARLKFRVTNQSPHSGNLYALTDNNWDEDTITYDNRPVLHGSALADLGEDDRWGKYRGGCHAGYLRQWELHLRHRFY